MTSDLGTVPQAAILAFPRTPPAQNPGPLTLAEYGREKGFAVDWLRELGLTEDARGVRIPYLDEQGQVAALRWRLREDAPARFLWAPGTQPVPYGLWLPLNRDAKGLMLVEGESDAHTLWKMGLPGLGIPGAATFRPAWAAALRDRPLWLHVENDRGGQTFVTRTVQLLREVGHRGPIYRFACADLHSDCKDINDLYLKLGGQQAAAAIRQALMLRIPVEQAPPAPSAPAVVQPQALDAYQAKALWGAVLPRPLMVLDNTLTAGLALLAGAPKKGKSWLALALGLAVAEGKPLLGRSTRRGEVLYLDLESRQYRVQERLATLHDGPPPEGLYITHRAPRLGDGLVASLAAWVSAHPQTALIIVDTLARIKCPGAGGENAYEADTRIMGALQRFALDHGLCVLLIHHLRKSVGGVKEQDVYERVSGSTGLTGVCDCVLVLDGKRQTPEAQLYVDGRDIPPAQVALGFEQGRWSVLSEDGAAWQSGTAYEASPLPKALKQLMTGRDKWEGTASQLVEALGEVSEGGVDLRPDELSGQLNKLKDPIAKREGIAIQRATLKGRRLIRLSVTRADSAQG